MVKLLEVCFSLSACTCSLFGWPVRCERGVMQGGVLVVRIECGPLFVATLTLNSVVLVEPVLNDMQSRLPSNDIVSDLAPPHSFLDNAFRHAFPCNTNNEYKRAGIVFSPQRVYQTCWQQWGPCVFQLLWPSPCCSLPSQVRSVCLDKADCSGRYQNSVCIN